MPIAQYARVRLLTDAFANEGAPKGTCGYVIEILDADHYEVEVSDWKTGATTAQFVASEGDLVGVPEP